MWPPPRDRNFIDCSGGTTNQTKWPCLWHEGSVYVHGLVSMTEDVEPSVEYYKVNDIEFTEALRQQRDHGDSGRICDVLEDHFDSRYFVYEYDKFEHFNSSGGSEPVAIDGADSDGTSTHVPEDSGQNTSDSDTEGAIASTLTSSSTAITTTSHRAEPNAQGTSVSWAAGNADDLPTSTTKNNKVKNHKKRKKKKHSWKTFNTENDQKGHQKATKKDPNTPPEKSGNFGFSPICQIGAPEVFGEPKVDQRGAKREPTGANTEPKGTQNLLIIKLYV